MLKRLRVQILPQPDDTTCGPTCLHAVYRYFGKRISLDRVVREVKSLKDGGTLAVLLACDALQRGFKATIYTYNLQIFDPTWFSPPAVDLADRLRKQAAAKQKQKLRFATRAYIDFLELGGRLRHQELTPALIRSYLDKEIPILTGLSSTYLYQTMRERARDDRPDDIHGTPVGHFVVLCGYDRVRRTVEIADPYRTNPVSRARNYDVPINRVLSSILLGILTYDANLLVLELPEKTSRRKPRAHRAGR